MKQIIFLVTLFFILVFEGVALELLPEKIVHTNLLIIPHWVFVFLILIILFYDNHKSLYALYYAALFGLLVDIVYTDVLGVYMFTYAVSIYIIHLLKSAFHTNIYTTILMTIIGLFLVESIIHFIYLTVDITDMLWIDHLIYRSLPTVLANLVLLLILYPMVKNILIRWGDSSQ